MRTLTIILIASIFICLGVLSSAEAKKQVCNAKASNAYCNPEVLVVPAANVKKAFVMSAWNISSVSIKLTTTDIFQTGNALELRSPRPFWCKQPGWNFWELSYRAFNEADEANRKYGDVATPDGWYVCDLHMLGRDYHDYWFVRLFPLSHNQYFEIEGYWVEED